MRSAEYWKGHLGLENHPSGIGYFNMLYRSEEEIEGKFLPARFIGSRFFCSTIYYLLEAGQISPLHKVKSDEQFNHIDGDGLTIYIFNEENKTFSCQIIGKDDNEYPHIIIPHGSWFAYEIKKGGKYALLTCTLSPAFNPIDFISPTEKDRINLLKLFPDKENIFNVFLSENFIYEE